MKELDADGSIKASVAELAALGKTIDSKPLVREYVEGLANVHVKIRALLEPRMKQAEELVLHWREHSASRPSLGRRPSVLWPAAYSRRLGRGVFRSDR